MWFVGAPASFGDGGDAVPPDDAVVPTRPGDRHLTLVYLGPMPADDVMRTWEGLPRLVLPPVAPARRWDRFGRRAIALVLADDDELLQRAAHSCFAVAEQHVPAFRAPTAYRAHVTLGRIRKGAAPPTRPAMGRWALPAAPVTLGPATLFRVHPERPRDSDRYEAIARQTPTAGSPSP